VKKGWGIFGQEKEGLGGSFEWGDGEGAEWRIGTVRFIAYRDRVIACVSEGKVSERLLSLLRGGMERKDGIDQALIMKGKQYQKSPLTRQGLHSKKIKKRCQMARQSKRGGKDLACRN